MTEKIKGMFGHPKRAEEVKEWLKSQGAKVNGYTCNADDLIYYVQTDGVVYCVNKRLAELFDIVELPKPQHEFKPFDKVLVREGEGMTWRCNFFSHKDGSFYASPDSLWVQCIPYEGNEHLVGTTINPEEEKI